MRSSIPARESAAVLGLLYVALAAVAVAPLVYGSYPPWLSGIAAASMCALGIVHCLLSLIFGFDSFPVPRPVAAASVALLFWLSAMTIRDVVLGTAQDRFPALSIRLLPYAFAYLAAECWGHLLARRNA